MSDVVEDRLVGADWASPCYPAEEHVVLWLEVSEPEGICGRTPSAGTPPHPRPLTGSYEFSQSRPLKTEKCTFEREQGAGSRVGCSLVKIIFS